MGIRALLIVLRGLARRGEIKLQQPALLGEGRSHFTNVVVLEGLREALIGGDHADREFGRRHLRSPPQIPSESVKKNIRSIAENRWYELREMREPRSTK